MSEDSKLEEYRNQDNLNSKEPALATGATTGTVAGILAIIGYLFPGAIDERTYVIILIAGVFLSPIISAIFTRGKVWSPASVKQLLAETVEETRKAVTGIQKTKSAPPKILE